MKVHVFFNNNNHNNNNPSVVVPTWREVCCILCYLRQFYQFHFQHCRKRTKRRRQRLNQQRPSQKRYFYLYFYDSMGNAYCYRFNRFHEQFLIQYFIPMLGYASNVLYFGRPLVIPFGTLWHSKRTEALQSQDGPKEVHAPVLRRQTMRTNRTKSLGAPLHYGYHCTDKTNSKSEGRPGAPSKASFHGKRWCAALSLPPPPLSSEALYMWMRAYSNSTKVHCLRHSRKNQCVKPIWS